MERSSLFVQSSPFLAELFGYMPITVIDAVIDAVNGVARKTVAGVDSYVGGVDDDLTRVDRSRERESGTEHLIDVFNRVIDDVFDRFELYAMRNVFVIEPALLHGGWVRQPYQEGVNFRDVEDAEWTAERLASTQRRVVEARSQLLVSRVVLEVVKRQNQQLERLSEQVPPIEKHFVSKLQAMEEGSRRIAELIPHTTRYLLATPVCNDSSGEDTRDPRDRFNEHFLEELVSRVSLDA